MITKETAIPGTEVIFDGVRQTTIIGQTYQDDELGLMIKTTLYPGGLPATKYELATTEKETGLAVKQTPIIVFKGKLVGELEETEITPALIEEKSKPLLALKINGIFDTEGAEKVKEAINKAVKMRTLVEKQADPVMKSINAKAKKDVQSVKDTAQPIYDACMVTQNALQKTYDDWALEVGKAKQKEADDFKAKTDGRDKQMFALGMMFNGMAFFNLGKNIAQDVLHAMSDEKYAELLTEIEGLKLEQDAIGTAPAPVPPAAPQPQQGSVGYGRPAAAPTPANTGSTAVMNQAVADRVYETAIYERALSELGVRIIITNGVIEPEPDALISNDRIKESSYFLQVVR